MQFNYQINFVIYIAILFTITSCSQEDSSTDVISTPVAQEPENVTEPESVASKSEAKAETEVVLSNYQTAIADPRRPTEDVERDVGRKPEQVMAFYGVAPGQHVLDLGSGGGYYTRIISSIVGPEGSVVAQNSGRRVNDEFKTKMQQQYEDYDNVKLSFEAPEQLTLPDNSLDAVFLILIIHHWHFSKDEGETVPALSKEKYANILRMLKPGGVFGVIEHESAEGTSREASAALHRIPRATAIADITSAGFVLDSESDVHANQPVDDITAEWFDNEPRDATKRITHLYRKPASPDPEG